MKSSLISGSALALFMYPFQTRHATNLSLIASRIHKSF